jgi:thiosulfate reductase cytochrome b subunit
MVAFVVVHLIMVVLAGPINELRSMDGLVPPAA